MAFRGIQICANSIDSADLHTGEGLRQEHETE